MSNMNMCISSLVIIIFVAAYKSKLQRRFNVTRGPVGPGKRVDGGVFL